MPTKSLHRWKVLNTLGSHVCCRSVVDDVICDAAGVNVSGTTFRSQQRGSRRSEAPTLMPDFSVFVAKCFHPFFQQLISDEQVWQKGCETRKCPSLADSKRWQQCIIYVFYNHILPKQHNVGIMWSPHAGRVKVASSCHRNALKNIWHPLNYGFDWKYRFLYFIF